MELLHLQLQLIEVEIKLKIQDVQRMKSSKRRVKSPQSPAEIHKHDKEVQYLVRDIHTISEEDETCESASGLSERLAHKFRRLLVAQGAQQALT